jgi:hypothetical protein
MKTITVYTPQELHDKFPEAFERAHEKWRDEMTDIPWTDEIMDSLKAVFEHAGIHLQDYSISSEGYRSYIKFGMDDDEQDLTGQKAYTWIKANLLDGAKFRRVTYDKKLGGKGWRYDITKKDGTAWCCEFTGVCFDDDFVDSLLDDIRGGGTLYEAFKNLANCASHLFELEEEYMRSEDEFLIQDHLQFTEDGRMV